MFENNVDRTVHKDIFFPKGKWKITMLWSMDNYFFDHPVIKYMRTYDNIRKIVIGQGDDYKTDCLQDLAYLKKYYKMIAIDLSKKLDADPKAMQELLLLEI